MAKMFYSLEEAASKLGKSVDEVRELATKGQLQEFRDRDRLMFKVEQVDLLAGDDGGVIPLADAGGSSFSLSLEDSSSGSGAIALDEPKERSGISIFDTESTEEGDPSAVTRITETSGPAGELSLESVGSGSGLLDLTREGDDTSLGADLLEDVYKQDEGGDPSASGTQGSSGLFESTPAMSDMSTAGAGSPMMGMLAIEPYDGAGSGLVGGIAFGAVAVLMVAIAAVIMSIIGVIDNPIVNLVAGNFWMYIGIFAGVVLLSAIIGWAVLRKS